MSEIKAADELAKLAEIAERIYDWTGDEVVRNLIREGKLSDALSRVLEELKTASENRRLILINARGILALAINELAVRHSPSGMRKKS